MRPWVKNALFPSFQCPQLMWVVTYRRNNQWFLEWILSLTVATCRIIVRQPRRIAKTPEDRFSWLLAVPCLDCWLVFYSEGYRFHSLRMARLGRCLVHSKQMMTWKTRRKVQPMLPIYLCGYRRKAHLLACKTKVSPGPLMSTSTTFQEPRVSHMSVWRGQVSSRNRMKQDSAQL